MLRYVVLTMTGLLAVSSLALLASGEELFGFQMPAWVPLPIVPEDNPMSEAKVELGRHLFYDTALSVTGEMSCSSCHEQALAFTDGEATHKGVHGEPGLRNAQGLANVAYLPTLTWTNPNLKRLEDQILIPLFGDRPVELGMTGREQQLFGDLAGNPIYPQMFQAAFPGDSAISLSSVTKSLAAFMRSMMSFDSPYDRFVRNSDASGISEAALRGEALFFSERLECSHCHNGLNFTDNINRVGQSYPETNFHNTGLYNLDGKGSYPASNPGLVELTQKPADEGKFRTPSLRNVGLTAPYMHDGSVATLEEAISGHYALGGKAASGEHGVNPLRDMFIVGFSMTDEEQSDLIAFLNTLTDQTFITDPRFGNPFLGDNK